MSDIKKQLRKAYKLMPEGSKRRAAEIHGVTPMYFRNIIAGAIKDESTYYSAIQAVKQASSEALEVVKGQVSKINAIEVNQPERL